jgi:23S rRNA (pseudouridine1915-N3)-methyltransferase
VRIVLVCVGKVRAPFVDDVAHYERLLGRQARVETIELSEQKGDAARVLAAEGDALLRRIPGRAFVCALDRSGRESSSEALARFVEERRHEGRELWFVVGGPLGLGRRVLDRADHRLSLGPATLPHQLARVVLLEQLFRAHKILAGEPYHC